MFTEFINHIKNTKQSFAVVKQDVRNLWGHIQNDRVVLREMQQRIDRLQRQILKLESAASQVQAEQKRELVGNSDSHKVHEDHCVYARNILPEHKVSFESLSTARNIGYDPCVCLEA